MPWNEVMGKFKKGSLRSGGGGKVKDRKQAIAIMMSEKRAAQGGKTEYQAKSNMPKGGKLKGNWGDIGALRQEEAVKMGGFHDGAVVKASSAL